MLHRVKYMFNVQGKVKAKQSVKFAKVGNFIKTYTPKDIVEYSNWVRQCFLNKYPDAKASDLDGKYLFIDIVTTFKIPNSFSKKKRNMALKYQIFPTVKPDWDNIAKNICDSLNGIAYSDDKAIVEGKVRKLYGTIDFVSVTIGTIEYD